MAISGRVLAYFRSKSIQRDLQNSKYNTVQLAIQIFLPQFTKFPTSTLKGAIECCSKTETREPWPGLIYCPNSKVKGTCYYSSFAYTVRMKSALHPPKKILSDTLYLVVCVLNCRQLAPFFPLAPPSATLI